MQVHWPIKVPDWPVGLRFTYWAMNAQQLASITMTTSLLDLGESQEVFKNYFSQAARPSLKDLYEFNREFFVKASPQNKVRDRWIRKFNDVAKDFSVQTVDKEEPPWLTIFEQILIRNQKDAYFGSPQTSFASASKSDSHPLTPEARAEFEQKFKAMKQENKWKLRDNLYVEDVIYNFGEKATNEHAAHSFILNVSDPCWEKEFDTDDLNAIRTYGQYQLPTLNSHVSDFFGAYTTQNNKDSQHNSQAVDAIDFLIKTTNELGPFDPRTDHETYWIYTVMLQFNAYYCNNVLDGVSIWTEQDFVSHVWSALDRSFHPLRVITTRDQTCMSSSKRLNNERAVTGDSVVQAKRRAVRPDLVLLKNNLEYGCSEVGKNLSATSDKKEIVESQLHSPKIMKDMFCAILEKANNDIQVGRKSKVVCLNETGLTMWLSIMDCPNGYVCRVVQSAKYEIPLQAELVISQLFPILKLVSQAKCIVQNTIGVIDKYLKEPQEPRLDFEPGVEKLLLPSCLTAPIMPTASRKRKPVNQDSSSESSSAKRQTSIS